jgi:Family of unknown function (DUF5989)
MQFIENLTNRMRIAGALLQFFLQTKWWWLTPALVLLLIMSGLIIVTQGSAITPFIYVLF